MAHWNEGAKRVPWLPVYDDGTEREPVAPSKPVVPARTPAGSDPEPAVIDGPDADVIAPVTMPEPQEVLPTDAHAPWDVVPVFSVPTDAPITPAMDPIQSLGDAAVRRASLLASGAATPLGGGAPSAPSAYSVPAPNTESQPVSPYLSAPTPATSLQDPPWLSTPSASAPHTESADDHDATQATTDHVAAGAGVAPASAVLPAAVAPGFLTPPPPRSALSAPQVSTPEPGEGPTNYAPILSPAVPSPTGANDTGGDEPPTKKAKAPWWRSWPFLVVIGLLVMGGIAYAVITALSDTEPVELTPEVIVAEPEEPTHEPISIESPTSFQEALPEVVGLYALTEFDSPDVATLELVEQVAEANVLTYQYEDTTLSVRALQHFDAETALKHFDTIAADGTDRTPVSAGSTDVGERVNLTAEDGETIVWRNSSALFFVTGPADAVEEFFTQFPL